MRLAITGATGMIGSALSRELGLAGHRVLPVSRHELPGGVKWNPAANRLDAASLEGCDAVIHLAGAGIADQRWSDARKRELLESRTRPTALLANTLASLDTPPRVLVSMSAIGIYGDRGDTVISDDSETGSGFLADLGRAWEAAADPARKAGIRVVHPRTGVVLTTRGGALPRMLTPFRLGVAGRLGSGTQWLGWITLRDAVAALMHVASDDEISGPINLCSPAPVTNIEFTRTLARTIRRPAVIPVPGLLLRILYGEMAEATLLQSQRATPTTLMARGFEFQDPDLAAALKRLLRPER